VERRGEERRGEGRGGENLVELDLGQLPNPAEVPFSALSSLPVVESNNEQASEDTPALGTPSPVPQSWNQKQKAHGFNPETLLRISPSPCSIHIVGTAQSFRVRST
jgi:hypothetical protein